MPMIGSDNFWTGPHHFWTHFWCGLVFGGALGVWIGSQISDNGWPVFAVTVGAALAVAISSGRWGDRFWRWLIEHLFWFI